MTNNDWCEFLGRPPVKTDASGWKSANVGKAVLVTGAGGSIGSHLARAIFESQPRELILLDSSEQNLHRICTDLAALSREATITAVLADVCDAAALKDVFEGRCVEIVYHAAAFKHVPLLEFNPLAAIRNNAMGTYVLAKAAAGCEVAQLLAISTDKAANPRSVLGASKRIAELVLRGLSNSTTRMNSIRFGNVLGTAGSVVPRFIEQIAQGGPVAVTHAEARRYFLTIDESLELVKAAASCPEGGNVFVPEMGEPIKIVELAEYLIRKAGFAPREEIAIEFVGLRPGDKMEEELVAPHERREGKIGGCLYRLNTQKISAREVHDFAANLLKHLERRDVPALIESVCRIVPEYQSSKELLASLNLNSSACSAASHS